jgi:hypothetical protein
MAEKLAILRAEQIKGAFLVYAHTTFALGCREYWTGFHWHPWKNTGTPHGFGELQDSAEQHRRVSA